MDIVDCKDHFNPEHFVIGKKINWSLVLGQWIFGEMIENNALRLIDVSNAFEGAYCLKGKKV